MQQLSSLAAGLILDRSLSLADAVQLINGHQTLMLSATANARCAAAHARLAKIISDQRHVYGITTGFGPLANRLVSAFDGAVLQQNLVNHLATGVGPAFGWRQGRAIVLARLMSIVQGVSGASASAIHALVTLINSDLSPVIPSKGTVGASGDLTPLAHMVLCFQGVGFFLAKDGQQVAAVEALAGLKLPIMDLSQRDGLALVNGTSAMTGVAVLNVAATDRAISWATALTAGFAETQNARVEAWDAVFSEVRPHDGQRQTAADLRKMVADSQRVQRTRLSDRRLNGLGHVTELLAGQDAYSLRCAPQVIGAVRDTASWHGAVVSVELCSATDNPIFPDVGADEMIALHGGNFMGQHVGLASDALSNAIVVLAGLAERQIARLTDETLNRGLPAFLHRGPAGLNSGFMGAQVTATALLAEMRCIGAASVQSISTNGANQDVVSMGTIAARLLADKLETIIKIQAILAMAVAQAMDILDLAPAGPAFSHHALELRKMIRSVSPAVLQDRPLGGEIETVSQMLSQSDPPSVLAQT
jgi:tyrosine ammonia-lyase